MNYIRLFFVVALFFAGADSSMACDICGCNMSGNYGGIYPQFTKNIVGFRYGFQRFRHPNTDLNFNGTSRVLRDEFQTYEVWGRFYPHPRIQVFAFIPFKHHVRYESERATEISGVGDISVMANYTFFNTADSTEGKWKHALLGGAGVKLPTGKYMARDERGVSLPAQFQMGTGAYTLNLNANYTLRYGNLGINLDYVFRVNGENERTYQFGDQQALSGGVFYTITTPKAAFLPNLGISYEHYQRDTEFGTIKEQTGGELSLINAGLDVYVDRFFLRTFMQMPIKQNLPLAQPDSDTRINLGIAYTF